MPGPAAPSRTAPSGAPGWKRSRDTPPHTDGPPTGDDRRLDAGRVWVLSAEVPQASTPVAARVPLGARGSAQMSRAHDVPMRSSRPADVPAGQGRSRFRMSVMAFVATWLI